LLPVYAAHTVNLIYGFFTRRHDILIAQDRRSMMLFFISFVLPPASVLPPRVISATTPFYYAKDVVERAVAAAMTYAHDERAVRARSKGA